MSEPGDRRAARLVAAHRVDGATSTVELRGSLHAETACVVREAVVVALERGPTTIVIDLADVVAADDLGLWVLPAMVGHAQGRHAVLLLLVPAPALRRRLRRLSGRPLDILESR